MEKGNYYRQQILIDGGLLSIITDTVPVGIVMVDDQGVIKFANPKAEQILGLTHNEITHIPYNAPSFRITDLHGDPLPEEQLPFRRVQTSLKPVTDIEHAIERPDGTRVLLSVNAAPILDADHRFIGVVTALDDITERIRAEETLKESLRESKFLADLLEHSSQPFVSGLLDGKLLKFNSAYSRLIGYTEEETVSLDWRADLTPPEWRDREFFILGELQRTGTPVRYEKEYFRKDGTRVPVELLVHVAMEPDGVPKFYYSFITDISERKRSEEIIRHKDALL